MSILVALLVMCISIYIMNMVYITIYDQLLNSKEQVSKEFNYKLISIFLQFLLIIFPFIIFHILIPIQVFKSTYRKVKIYFNLKNKSIFSVGTSANGSFYSD
jgi:membrane protease YdiL (CAAX protease family)